VEINQLLLLEHIGARAISLCFGLALGRRQSARRPRSEENIFQLNRGDILEGPRIELEESHGGMLLIGAERDKTPTPVSIIGTNRCKISRILERITTLL
jgi:hypothetical protein